MFEAPVNRESPATLNPERAPCDAAEALVVIEREQRFSRSLLWRLQRAFFEREGIEAWRNNTVPHHVTNNPALAHAYAQVALGFLRDLCAGGRIDLAAPLTLVELGAGSGRFAFLFLRVFLRLLRASALADVRVRYVLTDLAEKNVAFARAHEALRPFIAEGVLDFALFDVERDEELRLLESGVTLGPGSLGQPLVVIANYVFDGIPQDAFSFCGGALHEQLVTLRGRETDRTDPDAICRIAVEYSLREAPLDYYGDPLLDEILRGYAQRLDGDAILFPIAAVRCLERLAALASGRLLLLCGDKGRVDEEALRGEGAPSMAMHGSFSMPVNYHALGAYAERRGGRTLMPPRRHASLKTVGLLLGEHPSGYAETRAAYGEVFARTGPDDLVALRRGIQNRYDELTLDQLAALVRLVHHDPRVLADCVPAISEQLEGASPAARQELAQLVTECWANYYPLGEDHDLAFELASLLLQLDEPRLALALFADSARRRGAEPPTLWHMGLCHAALGDADAAERCFAEATDNGFIPDPPASPR